MATKGGSEALYKNHLKAQGKGRMTPGGFDRNNLGNGAVNAHAGGSKQFGATPKVGKGKAHDGRP